MNDTTMRKTIAENLKKFREQHKLSQSELGAKFGKEKTTISTWERGVSMPDIVTLHKLSKLYDVKLEDFYVQMPTVRIQANEDGSIKVKEIKPKPKHHLTKKINKVNVVLVNSDKGFSVIEKEVDLELKSKTFKPQKAPTIKTKPVAKVKPAT